MAYTQAQLMDLWCSTGVYSWTVFFILYIEPLSSVTYQHPLSYHLYAYYSQTYKFNQPTEVDATIQEYKGIF
jgi:hypothetical protein